MANEIRIAGSGANGSDGGNSWSNPGNITADDSSYASVTTASFGTSNTEALKAQNFGFNLPNSTINGFIVTFSARKASGIAGIEDIIVQLLNASGTATGNQKSSGSNWGTSFATKTLGGSADKWGTTLTYTDVNDPDFGVKIRCHDNHTSFGATGEINWVKINVYYTLNNTPMAAVLTNTASFTAALVGSARLSSVLTNTASFVARLQTTALFKAVLTNTASFVPKLQTSALLKAVLTNTASFVVNLAAVSNFKAVLTNVATFTAYLGSSSRLSAVVTHATSFSAWLKLPVLISALLTNVESFSASIQSRALLTAVLTNTSRFAAYLRGWSTVLPGSSIWTPKTEVATSWLQKAVDSNTWTAVDPPSDIWTDKEPDETTWSNK